LKKFFDIPFSLSMPDEINSSVFGFYHEAILS
jgi:hypothetical protein